MKTTIRALDFDRTQMGYSLKSQDRAWVVFAFDDHSEDEDYRGLRMYPLQLDGYGDSRVWGYDLLDDDTIAFTSRAEAEAAAEEIRGQQPTPHVDVYVINVGDDSRWETAWLDRGEYLTRGKYRGSDAALAEMTRRAKERHDA